MHAMTLMLLDGAVVQSAKELRNLAYSVAEECGRVGLDGSSYIDLVDKLDEWLLRNRTQRRRKVVGVG